VVGQFLLNLAIGRGTGPPATNPYPSHHRNQPTAHVRGAAIYGRTF
jgi:hypothetical protein